MGIFKNIKDKAKDTAKIIGDSTPPIPGVIVDMTASAKEGILAHAGTAKSKALNLKDLAVQSINPAELLKIGGQVTAAALKGGVASLHELLPDLDTIALEKIKSLIPERKKKWEQSLPNSTGDLKLLADGGALAGLEGLFYVMAEVGVFFPPVLIPGIIGGIVVGIVNSKTQKDKSFKTSAVVNDSALDSAYEESIFNSVDNKSNMHIVPDGKEVEEATVMPYLIKNTSKSFREILMSFNLKGGAEAYRKHAFIPRGIEAAVSSMPSMSDNTKAYFLMHDPQTQADQEVNYVPKMSEVFQVGEVV